MKRRTCQCGAEGGGDLRSAILQLKVRHASAVFDFRTLPMQFGRSPRGGLLQPGQLGVGNSRVGVWGRRLLTMVGLWFNWGLFLCCFGALWKNVLQLLEFPVRFRVNIAGNR